MPALLALLALLTAGLSMVGVKSAFAGASAPAWWHGTTCDTYNYPGSYPLAASYNGVQACAPGPYQGGTDHLVNFGAGAGEYEWECVELSMRYMYLVYGIAPWVLPGGNAYSIVSSYSGSVLTKVGNNTGSLPTPGDILAFAPNTNGHGSTGHTAVVTSVDTSTSTVTFMQQNMQNNNGWGTLTYSANGNLGSGVTGWLHNPNYTPPSSTNAVTTPNTHVMRLHGDFTGDGKDDVAAITPRGTSTPSGVNISMLQNTGSAFNNVGLWYYNTGVDIYTSRYVTGDFNGDGKADIAIVTPRGTSTPSGINVTVLLSTGSGFTDSGLWYYDTGADINSAKFLTGYFTGSTTKTDIAVVTPRGTSTPSGVNISMLQDTGSAFNNVGLWYYDTGVDINSSKYVTGDFGGDSRTDLALVTPRGTSTPSGINVSFLQNTDTSFNNVGLWYYDTGVDINASRFLGGYFTAGSKEDIAAITPRGMSTPSGINISMLQNTGTTFNNVGLWYYDNGVDINGARYTTGNFSGSATRTDIAVVTPRGTSTPSGVNVSTLQNTGSAFSNIGLWYYDTGIDINSSQWS